MRIITNETLYRRSTRAAFIANIGGMFLLVASVFVLFNAPERFGLFYIHAGLFQLPLAFRFLVLVEFEPERIFHHFSALARVCVQYSVGFSL